MKHKHIIAAGGVVFRIEHEVVSILLIFRNGVWDLPKGKLEKGESIEMCASREVSEETGTQLPIIVGDLGTTKHQYIQKNKKYNKTTYWYAMVISYHIQFVPQQNEGIEKIEWIILQEALKKVGFDNLKQILLRFQNWIN